MHPEFPTTQNEPEISNQPKKLSPCTLNTTYFNPRYGILRLCIILSLFGGWIAAAAIFNKTQVSTGNEYVDTQVAYLVFSILAFVVSIIIFILSLLSIVDFTEGFTTKLIVIILDSAFAAAMGAVGIAAGVMESKISNYYLLIFFIRKGAYGAASAFGLLSAILLILSAIFHIIF